MRIMQPRASVSALCVVFSAAMLVAVLCAVLLSAAQASSRSDVSSWITQVDPASDEAMTLLEPTGLSSQTSFFSAKASISLNTRHQQMLGYGAGLPQASAFVLAGLKARNATAYQLVLQKLFTSQNGGANLNFLRFPIGSCDFSMTSTSYDEVQNDYDLSAFAVDADSEYIVEVLLDVKKVRPDLQLVATPWSAPSWLKVNDTLVAYSDNNTLLNTDAAYETFAAYLGKTLAAFQQRGLRVHYLALQNEPLFGTGTQYPGMFLSAASAVRLARLVAPLLPATQTKLLAYDHNWDEYSYPQTVLGNSSDFAGVAWHCYAGDMATAQEQLHASFPGSPQLLTECTGAYPGACNVTQGMTGFGGNHEWDMQNILLGAAAHWASAGLKWIIALDETCGPTLPAVTFTNGRPLVSIPSSAAALEDVYFNQDFWSLAHMGRFVAPGARRVNASLAVRGGAASQVLAAAFLDTARDEVTFEIMNLNHTLGLAISVADGLGADFSDYLPPYTTKVYQWPARLLQ